MSKFELQVLGTGAGASSVYEGLSSTAFMLLRDGEACCLIDLGLGIGHKIVEMFGGFPRDIIITHNHSDHAGDLPVVLRVEQAQGRLCRVIAQQDVAQRLQQFRLAEHAQQIPPQQLADWLAAPAESRVEMNEELQIEFIAGNHSELSYGFVMYYRQQALLSYTADSTLVPSLYEKLGQAATFIMDARPRPNDWHASFAEVQPWLKDGRYIAGHGLALTQVSEYPDLPLLKEGDRIVLAEGTIS